MGKYELDKELPGDQEEKTSPEELVSLGDNFYAREFVTPTDRTVAVFVGFQMKVRVEDPMTPFLSAAKIGKQRLQEVIAKEVQRWQNV